MLGEPNSEKVRPITIKNFDSSLSTICLNKAEKFKQVRKKRLKKLQKMRLVKKKARDWAMFIEGLRGSADKRVARPIGKKNIKQPVKKGSEEEEIILVITKMNWEEICELIKNTGVVNAKNEGTVCRRI